MKNRLEWIFTWEAAAKEKENSEVALLNQDLFIFYDKYQLFPINQLKLYTKMDKWI